MVIRLVQRGNKVWEVLSKKERKKMRLCHIVKLMINFWCSNHYVHNAIASSWHVKTRM